MLDQDTEKQIVSLSEAIESRFYGKVQRHSNQSWIYP